jgi:hypothetical protein
VKLLAVVVRVTPAATVPNADTLPNANVAALVPAPLESATPAASELNTSWIDPFTVADTVSVPLAVVCATAADEIIISAAKIVTIDIFFILVATPSFKLKLRYIKKLLRKSYYRKIYFLKKISWPWP